MKKTVFALLLAFAPAVGMQSQTRLSVTPRVGMNISDFSDDNGEYESPRVGFTAGVELERYGRLFGLSAGLMYSQQGAADGMDALTQWRYISIKETDHGVTMHYLQVPVMANFHVWKGLVVKVGVEMGYLLDARMSLHEYGYLDAAMPNDVPTITEVSPISFTVGRHIPEPSAAGMKQPERIDKHRSKSVRKDLDLSKVDVAVPVGVSYEYKNMVLDARYHFGLVKLRDGSYNNRYLSITAGYRF